MTAREIIRAFVLQYAVPQIAARQAVRQQGVR
jgi:hypothetical protein